jgi:hypothetical protein
MRALSPLVLIVLLAAGPAGAGDFRWRLDQLEYEARQQRYDLDMVQRQQAFDEVDRLGQASRARDQAVLDQLSRGPLGDDAPRSASRYWNFGR